jgi:hypothetical protein
LAATASSWNDAGLLPATGYTYTVAARYADGRVGVAQASVTTPNVVTTATAPTGATGTVPSAPSTITVAAGRLPELSWPAVKGAVEYRVTGTRAGFPAQRGATVAASAGRQTKWRWPAADPGFPPGIYDVLVSAQLSNGLVAEVGRAQINALQDAVVFKNVRVTNQQIQCKVEWPRSLSTTDLWVLRHPSDGNTFLFWRASAAANSSVIIDGTLTDGCSCPTFSCRGTYTVLMLHSDKSWYSSWGSVP